MDTPGKNARLMLPLLEELAEKDDEIERLRTACEKAVARAKVFDDGSDGADSESARSVVAILSAALTPNANVTGLAPGKDEQ